MVSSLVNPRRPASLWIRAFPTTASKVLANLELLPPVSGPLCPSPTTWCFFENVHYNFHFNDCFSTFTERCSLKDFRFLLQDGWIAESFSINSWKKKKKAPWGCIFTLSDKTLVNKPRRNPWLPCELEKPRCVCVLHYSLGTMAGTCSEGEELGPELYTM